jgi:hypothetical protein
MAVRRSLSIFSHQILVLINYTHVAAYLKVRKTLDIVSFVSRRPNRIPIQFLGPAPVEKKTLQVKRVRLVKMRPFVQYLFLD